MLKFECYVSQLVTHDATFLVEADSAEQAREIAMEEYNSGGLDFTAKDGDHGKVDIDVAEVKR